MSQHFLYIALILGISIQVSPAEIKYPGKMQTKFMNIPLGKDGFISVTWQPFERFDSEHIYPSNTITKRYPIYYGSSQHVSILLRVSSYLLCLSLYQPALVTSNFWLYFDKIWRLLLLKISLRTFLKPVLHASGSRDSVMKTFFMCTAQSIHLSCH